ALWAPRRRGRSGPVQGAAVLILSLAALWVLNPLSLMDPGGWFSGMIREAHVQRLLSTQAPIGVQRGLYPITQGLHIPGLILLIVAGARWAAQCRAGNLAPLVSLVLLLLGVRSGFASDAPLLILMPWAACEVGQGWGVIAAAISKRLQHAWFLRLLPLLLILPLLAVTAGRWETPSREAAGRASAVAWLEENLAPGSLVVHDAAFAAPDSSRLIWLGVPFHSTHPAIYRGTYWTGWYRAARAVVISERLVMRFLRQPREGREMLDFYTHLTETADADRAFGRPAGRRTRVLLFSPEKGAALGEAWRERVAAGAASGLPGVFLGSLGAALTQAGRAGAATDLLEESLSAGYENVGIWMNLANAHLAFGRTMEAGRVLDEACTQHPDSWQLQYNLGLILTRAGLWERAVRTLARLQREWPRSASVAYLLGLSLANDGRPEAARRQLERALELDVDLPERERAEELLELLSEQGR
ncbi:MAG: tetratricopeptide repeat protein, partial [Candidatus Eisenbacteria sp.]|nr:tetratricopeptide repeat protein [Candidatus Eisenbacteria bacterium]